MFFFIASSVARTQTVIAVDTNGVEHRFASIVYAERSNQPKVTPLFEAEFPDRNLTFFKIVRSDGVDIGVVAPPLTKSLNFRLSLVDETPVALEVTSTYRPGIQVTLNRARQMPLPVYQVQAPQQPGGIMGLLQRFWFIPLIFFAFKLFSGGGPAAAPAAQ
jgi:hypothetical protein